jgi:3-deoxy-7-phosphoheptulonate synthase
MILHLKKDTDQSIIQEIARKYNASVIHKNGSPVLVSSSKAKSVDPEYQKYIAEDFVFDDDIQMAHPDYVSGKRKVTVGDIYIGGDQQNSIVIGGPCSVESEEQIEKSARLMSELGVSTMRAGSYKPRTSPYSFQGLGFEGLKLLDKMRDKYGLNIITEVRDATHVEEVIEYADIVQIGAKAMYDHGILRRCGKADKPVLLKRGFGSKLQEFVQAAEFILSEGNDQVILCERGIRTFEDKTRFTLDLCGAVYLKYHTNLPVIIDPSHAMGQRYGVPDLAKAAMAMGVDGLLIETHPNPQKALSDAAQQLSHEDFKSLYNSLSNYAQLAGRQIV